MDEQCRTALDLLVQNGYLEIVKGKYRATARLNDEIAGKPTRLTEQDWADQYINFITACRIPSKGESGTGDLYDLNKYTTEGMKRFRQMVETEQVNTILLIKVTHAYYNGSIRYKKKIGNYITENLWRMDYELLKKQTPDQQQQTLQKQADESKPFTRDRIG